MNNIDVKGIRKKMGLTQAELAKRIGVETKTIQNWEYGKKIPETKYGILRGLLNAQQPHGDESSSGTSTTDLVPLLPISAQGGTLNDFTLSIKDTDCEKVISPIKDAELAITVSGESMAPEYPSGSKILIKKINERAFIDWGRVYVLDTCNGIVIKKLFPSEKDGCVCCKSINPEYPPFDVNLEDVYGVYRVMLCMSMK